MKLHMTATVLDVSARAPIARTLEVKPIHQAELYPLTQTDWPGSSN